MTDEEGVCDMVLSVAAGSGVGALVERLAPLVQQARAEAAVRDLERDRRAPPDPGGRGGAARRVRRAWVVQGRAAERAVALSDLNDEGAQAEVVRRLRRLGVDRALARAGARDGDEITVGAMTFTWGEDR